MAEIEIPIKVCAAREQLGLGVSFMSAVKRQMGIKNRKRVMLSEVRRWLAKNPDFREVDVYHRPECVCGDCLAKRSAPNWKPRGRRPVKSTQSVGAV